jgi:hypothetical protein
MQAAEKEIQFTLKGQQVAGQFSVVDASGLVLFGSFIPTVMPDGTEGVIAAWSVCIPAPPSPPICTDQVLGLAPRSAVTMLPGGNGVELNFDTANMILLFGSAGPSTWKGTFVRYNGFFAHSVETTGDQESKDIIPGSPDPNVVWTLVQKTTGKRHESTAIFNGTIGSRPVASPLPNGTFSTHSGGVAVFRITAP